MSKLFTAGVDEVGRGCLAGPVVSAAVILKNGIKLNLLRDSKKISFKNAYYIGSIIEFLWKALNLRRHPPMTRFIASQLAHDHWFSNESAEKDIGYKPKIDMMTNS